MPTYISLINWTDQGIRNYEGTVDRANAAKDVAQRMGGTLREVYWTVGAYDIVAITDFPDEQAAMAFLLSLGSQGNIRTTTLTAHTADEMSEVMSRLG